MPDEILIHAHAALWVAEHGQPYKHGGTPLPVGLRLGRAGICFENAQRAVLSHGLRYVEGFAGPLSDGSPWTLHGWNLDAAGDLIDPTWDDDPGPHGHYFGIEFADLPQGDDLGVSVISQMIAGKLLAIDPRWDRRGAMEIRDADAPLAAAVRAAGGAIWPSSLRGPVRP